MKKECQILLSERAGATAVQPTETYLSIRRARPSQHYNQSAFSDQSRRALRHYPQSDESRSAARNTSHPSTSTALRLPDPLSPFSDKITSTQARVKNPQESLRQGNIDESRPDLGTCLIEEHADSSRPLIKPRCGTCIGIYFLYLLVLAGS